jgi:paired amphipathic helix protein Sin3a
VVSGAVRQLQHLVCDEAPAQCTSVYLAEGRRGGAGGSLASADARAPLELQYIRNMEKYLADENCFKIYSVRCVVFIFSLTCVVEIFSVRCLFKKIELDV